METTVAGALVRSVRADCDRVPLPDRLLEMESDRASALWPDQHQLGRPALADLGDPPEFHLRDPDAHGPDGPGVSRPPAVPDRREGVGWRDGQPATRTPCSLSTLELYYPPSPAGRRDDCSVAHDGNLIL